MVLYSCDLCFFSSKLKGNYDRHLKTKKHLNKLKESTSLCKKKNETPSDFLQKEKKNPPKPSKTLQNRKNTKNKNENLEEKWCENKKKNENTHKEFDTIKNSENNENSEIFVENFDENNENFDENCENYTKILKKGKTNKIFYICNNCDKMFSRKDNLKRHNDGRCKKKVENLDYKELFYEAKNQLADEKKQFKKQIELLLTKVGNTTTINNTQNIQLNSYGSEDMSHITSVLKNELLKIPYIMIPKLIEAVHFNDSKPENKNICLPNKKDNLIKIYSGNKWVYKNKDDTLNDLIDRKYTILDSHYDEVDKNDPNNLSSFIRMNYLKFRKYYDEGDKELEEQIRKECDLILLNNR